MRAKISDVKEILTNAFQLTKFRMLGAEPVINAILGSSDKDYREKMLKIVDELLPVFKGEEVGGMKLEHHSSDEKMWWVRIEQETNEKDKNGNNIIRVDNLGDFDTEEEADAFCKQYEKEHPDEKYELETIEFDPDECWFISGENGVKQYCEEQGQEVYPTYSSERTAEAVMVARLGSDYLPETTKYLVTVLHKRAEERLLKAIFGNEGEEE